MSQSLEICEGLEEWAGQQELSNCSDTEEEEGTQLVGDGTPRGLPLPLLLTANACVLAVCLRKSLSQCGQ